MIRQTRQRDAILRALREAGRPVTIVELHALARADVPRLGLRTVYRQVRDLVTEGVLVAVDYPGQPLRYEAVTTGVHRPHFICRQCEKVYVLNIEIPDLNPPEPPGFTIEGEEVVFYGICPACQKK